MIVKNEEEVLARCLDSIRDLVDEIIIVDTESSDTTKEIAGHYTNKIYDFEWINDFSAARNFSFSKATMDYQLWLDADDVILEKDRIKFRELKETLSIDTDMVLMNYVLTVDEKGKSTNSLFRERLVKRENNYSWQGAVHECIIYGGNYRISDIEIHHKEKYEEVLSDRNLKIYEEQLNKGISLSPRSLYYYARELRDHDQAEMAVSVFNEFLLTKQGAVWDNVNACLDMGRLYRKLGSVEDALKVLLHSFTYDLPTAEVCCEIASIYGEKEDYLKAIFWYNLIFSLKIPENYYATMITVDCWNFVPAIEMCVCYHALGNKEKAVYYNNLAASFKPDHPSVLSNRDFFVRMEEKTAYYVTEMMRMRNLNLV